MLDAHYSTKLLIWYVSMRQLGDAMRRKLRIRDDSVSIVLDNAAVVMNRSIE